PAELVLDRANGQAEFTADFLVIASDGQQSQDVPLAWRECLADAVRHRRCLAGLPGEFGHQFRGHRGFEERLSRHRETNCLADLGERRSLQQITHGSRTQRAEDFLVFLKCGENDHARGRARRQYAACGIHAIDPRQSEIHQHGVRRDARGAIHGLFAIRSLADDLEIRSQAEQGAQTFTKHRLIVHQEHTDGLHSGTSTRSTNPPSWLRPMSMRPPSISMRSRTPFRPKPLLSVCGRGPTPSSAISSLRPAGSPNSSRTSTRRARACLRTLVSPSCRIRISVCSIASATGRDAPRCVRAVSSPETEFTSNSTWRDSETAGWWMCHALMERRTSARASWASDWTFARASVVRDVSTDISSLAASFWIAMAVR